MLEDFGSEDICCPRLIRVLEFEPVCGGQDKYARTEVYAGLQWHLVDHHRDFTPLHGPRTANTRLFRSAKKTA